MRPSQVAIVLPVFQRDFERFATRFFHHVRGCRDPNICMELHYYHCFECEWNGMTFAEHLRAVDAHERELQLCPTVVGEWSLALGRGAHPGRLTPTDMASLFAREQLAAYASASHGW